MLELFIGPLCGPCRPLPAVGKVRLYQYFCFVTATCPSAAALYWDYMAMVGRSCDGNVWARWRLNSREQRQIHPLHYLVDHITQE